MQIVPWSQEASRMDCGDQGTINGRATDRPNVPDYDYYNHHHCTTTEAMGWSGRVGSINWADEGALGIITVLYMYLSQWKMMV